MYQAVNAFNQPAALGNQTAFANQAQNANYGAVAQPAPPLTLASALSRMEGLNERISQARDSLAKIASLLGALHPAEDMPPKAAQIPSGAVGRLNDVADLGHERLCTIENLLSGIERALG
jgi:hypothetical protein